MVHDRLRTLASFAPDTNEKDALSNIVAILSWYIHQINPRLRVEAFICKIGEPEAVAKIETLRIIIDENVVKIGVPRQLICSALGRVVLPRILCPLTAIAFATRDYDSASLNLLVELGDIARFGGVGFSASNDKTILVPDSEFFISEGYEDFRRAMDQSRVDWHARHGRIFWRGSTTGVPGPLREHYRPSDDFRLLPRLELCDRLNSGRLEGCCDVKISAIVQIDKTSMIEKIRASGLIGQRIEKQHFARAKFLIDIDGNSNAWSGLFRNLLTSGCVLKVASESGFKQWYYDRLEPWVNYVPVAADMSDLEDAIDWVLTNDEGARRIGEEGYGLATSITFEAAMNEAIKAMSDIMARASF